MPLNNLNFEFSVKSLFIYYLFSSDDGYAGSTIRVGTTSAPKLTGGNSPPVTSTPLRSQSQSQSRSRSRSSGSSGLGSGSSRKHFLNGLYPSQMPPVERLGMDSANSFKAKKSPKLWGLTTYDDDNIPRTEL